MLFLRKSVSQIIQVNALAIPICVRRDETEAIEMRANCFQLDWDFQPSGFAIELYEDGTVRIGTARLVNQAPGMGNAIGINVRSAVCRFGFRAVNAKRWREEKSFPTRRADR